MFEKLTGFTKKVSDLADRPTLNSVELKAQFDAAPDEVRVYLNKLIDSLQKTTIGDSGAKNIGASTISGLAGGDVQSLLEALKVVTDNQGKTIGEHTTSLTEIDGRVDVLEANRVEVHELSFNSSGSVNVLQTTFAFPKAFTSAPIVKPGNITQTVSYSDTMPYPLIFNVTTTSFSVKLITINQANNFGPGTLKMKFEVSGK